MAGGSNGLHKYLDASAWGSIQDVGRLVPVSAAYIPAIGLEGAVMHNVAIQGFPGHQRGRPVDPGITSRDLGQTESVFCSRSPNIYQYSGPYSFS